MSLTKQDIDALVDRMTRGGDDWAYVLADPDADDGGVWVSHRQLKRSLYLAAGLTAEGERKPERVRCYLYEYPNGAAEFKGGYFPTACSRVTPGWFVPDGEEEP